MQVRSPTRRDVAEPRRIPPLATKSREKSGSSRETRDRSEEGRSAKKTGDFVDLKGVVKGSSSSPSVGQERSPGKEQERSTPSRSASRTASKDGQERSPPRRARTASPSDIVGEGSKRAGVRRAKTGYEPLHEERAGGARPPLESPLEDLGDHHEDYQLPRFSNKRKGTAAKSRSTSPPPADRKRRSPRSSPSPRGGGRSPATKSSRRRSPRSSPSGSPGYDYEEDFSPSSANKLRRARQRLSLFLYEHKEALKHEAEKRTALRADLHDLMGEIQSSMKYQPELESEEGDAFLSYVNEQLALQQRLEEERIQKTPGLAQVGFLGL